MAQTNETRNCTILQSIPKDVWWGNAISINDHEFIIASAHDKYKYVGHIYKYNIHENEWKLFIKYPSKLDIKGQQLALDKNTKKLYLFGLGNLMTMVDTETKQWNTCIVRHKKEQFWDSGLINANGIIHTIGGAENPKHFIWSNTNNIFEEIYDFKEYNSIWYPSLVYVPSKKIILLIGGADCKTDTISNIWRYCLVSNKWTKINGVKIDICACKSVLTSNENYVIIGGGYNGSWQSRNEIYVLDIRDKNNYILKKSSICCPLNGEHMMVRSGNRLKDESIVIGYIKILFKSKEFNNLQIPPLYIMKLISVRYNQEMIHWIEKEDVDTRDKENHFGIYVKHILSSCNDSI